MKIHSKINLNKLLKTKLIIKYQNKKFILKGIIENENIRTIK